MCRAVKCRTCQKTTWAGCGQHVAMVKQTVPASEWCNGKHTKAQLEEAKGRPSTGIFARLFNR